MSAPRNYPAGNKHGHQRKKALRKWQNKQRSRKREYTHWDAQSSSQAESLMSLQETAQGSRADYHRNRKRKEVKGAHRLSLERAWNVQRPMNQPWRKRHNNHCAHNSQQHHQKQRSPDQRRNVSIVAAAQFASGQLGERPAQSEVEKGGITDQCPHKR